MSAHNRKRPWEGGGHQSEPPHKKVQTSDHKEALPEVFAKIQSWLTELPTSTPDEKTFRQGLKRELMRACSHGHTKSAPNSSDNLPGPLPASVTRASLRELHSKAYWVCEKSEGERMMFFAKHGRAFLVDRRFVFLEIKGCPAFLALFPNGATILDGELLSPTAVPEAMAHSTSQSSSSSSSTASATPAFPVPATHGAVMNLMLFDAISVDGQPCANRHYSQRLKELGRVTARYRQALEQNSLGHHLPPVAHVAALCVG